VVEVIDVGIEGERDLNLRETPAFLRVAHRVREALRAGHSYD
jgi:NitT/TauT family transport system ATP-binding protein